MGKEPTLVETLAARAVDPPTSGTILANSGLYVHSPSQANYMRVSVDNDFDPLIETSTGTLIVDGDLVCNSVTVASGWQLFEPTIDRVSSEMMVTLTEPIPAGGYPCYWMRVGELIHVRGFFSASCSGTIGNHFAILLPFDCPTGYPQVASVAAIVPMMVRKVVPDFYYGIVEGSSLTLIASSQFQPTNDLCFQAVVAPQEEAWTTERNSQQRLAKNQQPITGTASAPSSKSSSVKTRWQWIRSKLPWREPSGS